MAEKIASNRFSVSLNQILDDYAIDVQAAVGGAVEEAGKMALRVVRKKSPKRSGKYAKSWNMKVEAGGVFGSQIKAIIHNKKYYRLTHLLEDGHQKAGGGRVEGIPHVQPAVDEADRVLLSLATRAIEEAGGK